jgi:hypothetical protein
MCLEFFVSFCIDTIKNALKIVKSFAKAIKKSDIREGRLFCA